MSEIDKIEARTKDDLFGLLELNGIKKNDKWKGYSKAKKICFEGQFIDSEIYDKQIGWIVKYLGI